MEALSAADLRAKEMTYKGQLSKLVVPGSKSCKLIMRHWPFPSRRNSARQPQNSLPVAHFQKGLAENVTTAR